MKCHFPPFSYSAAPTPAEERKRTRQQRNERGETPLHVAAIRGDHDQVKKLLDQGQDPDVPDFAGKICVFAICVTLCSKAAQRSFLIETQLDFDYFSQPILFCYS